MAISESLGEVKELTVPAGTIRYRQRGRGPTLVFLHGAIVNGDKWRKVVPGLASEYTCVTPDWPLGSHELPMRPDADLSPPGIAQMIIDFVEVLGDEHVTLISNDTATAFTQLVLVRTPPQVKRAVLCHGDLYEHFFPRMFKPLTALAYVPGALRVMGLMGATTAFTKRLGYIPVSRTLKDPAIIDSYADPARRDAKVRRDLGKMLRGIRSRYTTEAAPLLSAFKCDVLLVWAPEDKLFPLSAAQRLLKEFDNAQLATISGSRTFIPEDQPDELVKTLRKFLRSTDPPSGSHGTAKRSATQQEAPGGA